ncbi:HAD family hydrolase [Enterococcus faecalis]|uniref:HAD family hydrolase n=1 Tax=Enterococcus faecalis TaxID=1351 RepID=UPI002DB79CA7|nr:HAD family hydrolase [Enterococcus faecalis]MEB7792178.1 HAD family hydrolase [Enterococcus faecalis]MEB7810178.1 HAD family hydrolase [Enterococcus faecalis]
MHNIKLIVFDLDNTLYDFNENWKKGHREIFRELLLDNEIDYNIFMDVYIKEDLRLWKHLSNGDITLKELRIFRVVNALKFFGKEFTTREGQHFYESMFKYLISSITIDNEINDLLEKLSVSCELVMLTNGFSNEQNLKINKLGFKDYFSKIYISEDIGIEKPDIRVFQRILTDKNISPENVLMIGDSLDNDILPAEKIGINTLHLNYSQLKMYDFRTVLGGF